MKHGLQEQAEQRSCRIPDVPGRSDSIFRRCLLLFFACVTATAVAAPAAPQFMLHNLHFQKFQEARFTGGAVVHAVHRDRKGRLWIGTEGGLFLYNGNEVRTFGQHQAGRDGLPNYFAKTIAEAGDGTIWIGTWGGGIAYFDEASRSMRVPEMTAVGKPVLPFDNKVWSMATDSRNRVWLGTFSSGLFRFDPSSGELQAIFQPQGEDTRGRRIDSLFIDEHDRAWFMALRSAVHVIDTQTLKAVPHLEQGAAACSNAARTQDIAAFPDGRMLIQTHRNLCVLNDDGQVAKDIDLALSNNDGVAMEALPYTDRDVLVGTASRLWYVNIETGDRFALPGGRRTAAIEPAITWDMDLTVDGDLLIGGTEGVWINPAVSRQFWTIAHDKGDGEFFENTRALVHEDDKLFLNTISDIYAIEFNGELTHPRLLRGRTINHAPIGYPMSMVTTDGALWVGTDSPGLIRLDMQGNAVDLPGTPSPPHSLLYDMSSGRVLAHGFSGLVAIDPASNAVRERTAPHGSMDDHGAHPNALHLSFGRHDDVWAGTFTGLFRYDRRTLAPLPTFSVEPADWNHPLVAFVHPLSDEDMLIGTGDGLFRARLDDSGAIRELRREFLDTPWSEVSFGAVFDAGPDRLLLATDYGLVEFNPRNETHHVLLNDDGMVTYRPYMGGFVQSAQHLAMLSGEDGPLLFYPEEVAIDAPAPSLVIADVLSFRGNTTKAWPLTEPLTFDHEDKVIRVKFGLLDYLVSENNRYRLRLKGFSEDWLDIGRLNEFSFTNLDAGKYRLEIRATDGVVDVQDVATLDFTVLPPWWQTWWAYATYAFVILGSLFAYWVSLQRKIRREQEISQRLREADRIKSHFLSELEEKVDLATQDLRHAVEALEIKNVELDAAQHRALDASRLKSEFLANMSHEIRTPMNGILGFTQLLAKSSLDHDQRDYVETIEKSATSLLGIVNDVLDVSKIEAGKLMIDNIGFSLRQCISDTLEALTPIAYEKNLELIGHVDASLPEGLRGDPVRLRQMITNLVANAVKFTDAGHVLVHVSGDTQDMQLRITVTDTGRGITAEDQERLFQAFERGSVKLAGRYTGTGLGLVITKKLCEAMGGNITLDSTPGKGTRMRLELPLVPDRNSENRHGYGEPLKGRRVLLIDADAHSRAALEMRFLHWGADVVAQSGTDGASAADADIAIIGIRRRDLGDADALQKTCAQLPAGLPRLCLAATIDRDALRSLSSACNADCVPKVGYRDGQLRRMLALLGLPPLDAADAIPVIAQQLKGLHVVIADDNRINRYFLRKILELHGARITEAQDGATVLHAIGTTASDADIVLLDIHMPDMDGLEVARRIRAGGRERLPLLAVSANVQPETYEAAVRAGINDYLLKPVDENKLVEAVLEWTGREEVTSDTL